MSKKIHVWAINRDEETFLIGCFNLNDEWHMPRGLLSNGVEIRITYEEE